MTEKEISEEAIRYVKENKRTILNKFANLSIYGKESLPISVFMAGYTAPSCQAP